MEQIAETSVEATESIHPKKPQAFHKKTTIDDYMFFDLHDSAKCSKCTINPDTETDATTDVDTDTETVAETVDTTDAETVAETDTEPRKTAIAEICGQLLDRNRNWTAHAIHEYGAEPIPMPAHVFINMLCGIWAERIFHDINSNEWPSPAGELITKYSVKGLAHYINHLRADMRKFGIISKTKRLTHTSTATNIGHRAIKKLAAFFVNEYVPFVIAHKDVPEFCDETKRYLLSTIQNTGDCKEYICKMSIYIRKIINDYIYSAIKM